jgi:hypothetical protein
MSLINYEASNYVIFFICLKFKYYPRRLVLEYNEALVTVWGLRLSHQWL